MSRMRTFCSILNDQVPNVAKELHSVPMRFTDYYSWMITTKQTYDIDTAVPANKPLPRGVGEVLSSVSVD